MQFQYVMKHSVNMQFESNFPQYGKEGWLLDNGCGTVAEQEHIISGLTMVDDDLGMLDRGLGHLGERSFLSSPESPASPSHGIFFSLSSFRTFKA